MVKWWQVQRDRSIKLTEFRIKHHEKHGNGKVAMIEKSQLLRQKKHDQDMKNQ